MLYGYLITRNNKLCCQNKTLSLGLLGWYMVKIKKVSPTKPQLSRELLDHLDVLSNT